VGKKPTITWAAFRFQNINLDLPQVDEPKPSKSDYEIGQPGAMHICWEVDDLPVVFDRMTAAGVEFHGPWHRVSRDEDGAEVGEGVVVAYFNGPDGEKLELIQPAGPFVRRQRAV
jgi:catechol 2,3-dioxygenase-like lactoylglutathione lyase family enzyme